MRLTTTSYAVLGMLAIRPWASYELTKQLRRSVRPVVSRAESQLYAEPKRLVALGLARASISTVGRRRRTTYEITAAGRAALSSWLDRPAEPTRLESEALLQVLFGNFVAPATLMEHLDRFAAEAEASDEPWRAIAREYVDGRGPFPERLHVNVLYWVMLDRWARLRAEWARWASKEVATWPDANGPRDRGRLLAILAGELEPPEA